MSECESVSIKYKGDGSEVLYTFPFTYMNTNDIVVFLYNEENKSWVDQAGKFVFANATTVEFLTPPPASDVDNIWITRKTDIEAMLATFYPGSSIRAQDLNDDFDQLRLAIQEGRCSLELAVSNLEDKTWDKNEAITRPEQESGFWQDSKDQKLATSDAIMARHDVHVADSLPYEPPIEQPGKGWQNTDDCWSSYWNPEASAWVAYVNTGPRGPQGEQGIKGDSIVGPAPGLQDPPAEASNVPVKDDGSLGDATADVEQDPNTLDLKFTFGIPEGRAATVDAGTTTTGAPGTDASVVNSGNKTDAVFDFTIPRGDAGAKGDKGDPVVTVSAQAPKNPVEGEIWFNADNAEAYFYYCDGSSCQWLSLVKPGPKGDKGESGDAATIQAGNTITGNPGTQAQVNNRGTSSAAIFDFTIPRGDKGETGLQGDAATITVGSTTTGAPGSDAEVTNVGTSKNAIFNFTIPTGNDGADGTNGSDGVDGTAATIDVGSVTTGAPGTNASVSNAGDTTNAIFDFTIPRGDKGETGPEGNPGNAATLDVGSTTTGAAGTNASVTNSGSNTAAIFNFTIPRGDKGDAGTDGSDGDDWEVYINDTAPVNPTEGQVWFNSSKGEAFIYYDDGNSNQWISLSKPGPPGADGADGADGDLITNTGDTAPLNPVNGQTWFNTSAGRLFIYYTDGVSSQWVQS